MQFLMLPSMVVTRNRTITLITYMMQSPISINTGQPQYIIYINVFPLFCVLLPCLWQCLVNIAYSRSPGDACDAASNVDCGLARRLHDVTIATYLGDTLQAYQACRNHVADVLRACQACRKTCCNHVALVKWQSVASLINGVRLAGAAGPCRTQ